MSTPGKLPISRPVPKAQRQVPDLHREGAGCCGQFSELDREVTGANSQELGSLLLCPEALNHPTRTGSCQDARRRAHRCFGASSTATQECLSCDIDRKCFALPRRLVCTCAWSRGLIRERFYFWCAQKTLSVFHENLNIFSSTGKTRRVSVIACARNLAAESLVMPAFSPEMWAIIARDYGYP